MKKRVRSFLKWGVVVFLGFFVLTVLIAVGFVFIFGEDAIDNPFGYLPFSGSNGVNNDKINENANDVFGSSNGGGGASGSSSGGESGSSFVCNGWEDVQYSIGNFIENIECLVYGINGCERVRAVCGSDVYNLDSDVGGAFAIRYSVYSGDTLGEEYDSHEGELSYEVVEKDIGANSKGTFVSEMTLDGEFDTSNLKCVVDKESVPTKCTG